jgi:hypothetical protein
MPASSTDVVRDISVAMTLAPMRPTQSDVLVWRFCLRGLETQRHCWRAAGLAVFSRMAALRKLSGRQALVGLVACFIALQALTAGLHAAHFIE